MELAWMSAWSYYGVVAITILPLIYWYLTRNFNHWTDRGVNGPPPVIGFGNILDMAKTPFQILDRKWLNTYGKVYGVFEGNKPKLVVADPVIIKQVFVKDFHLFPDHRTFGNAKHPIFDQNITFQRGEAWKRVRAIISPTFSSGKMRQMYPMVRQCLQNLIDQVFESLSRAGADVDLKRAYRDYTMDVIATCAFSTKIDVYKNRQNPFVLNARQLVSVDIWRFVLSLLLPTRVLNLLGIRSVFNGKAIDFFLHITRRLMAERKEKILNQKSNEKANDFLQLLIDAKLRDKDSAPRDEMDLCDAHYINEGEEELSIAKKALTVATTAKQLSEEEILANSVTIFGGGSETSAIALSYATYELALNPEIQDQLYQEVMSAVDANGEIDYDLLAKLEYLDAVLSETLRIHAPIIWTMRRAAADCKLGDTGIAISKGQDIDIPIYAIHMNEEFWPEAEQFRPDRFLPENRHKIIPYSYIPFGGGPRICIAMRLAIMEIKLCLAQVVRLFRFYRSPQTDVPLEYDRFPPFNSAKRLIVGIEKRIDLK